MARITRKHQKVFAGSASNNGQFGSAQATTKVLSSDPDVLQALGAFENGWNDATISSQKLPTLEEMQALHFLTTRQLSYLLQEGIPEYLAAATYYQKSIVKKPGTYEIYGSKTDDNTGNALPDAVDDDDWEYLGLIGGSTSSGQLPVGSIYMNRTVATNPATLLGYGTWTQISDTMIMAAGATYPASTSGGSATVTQTEAQLAAHYHVQGNPMETGHTASFLNGSINSTSRSLETVIVAGSSNEYVNTTSKGSASAMSNLPPYITAYVWERTA